jgi:uncharacterized protein DUF3854
MSAVGLTTEHAASLARFRIPSEMLEAAGVRSVSDIEAREVLGLNGHRGAHLAGILFPYLSPITGERIGGRIRLDNPLPDDGGKYISEPGCRHFFFPPQVANFIRNVNVPAVISEAEKSALALRALAYRAERPMLPIAIGGCWGWKRRTGKRELPDGSSEPETGPAPDLDLIVWHGRSVLLAFDSNARTSPKVQQARRALARELRQRGARVMVAEVPAAEGVNGPDDLIAVSGDDAMLSLLNSARPFVVITLQPGALPDAVDQAEEVLLDHCERLMVFQRAGELVRAICLPEPRKEGGLRCPAGSVQLESLSGAALTEVFDRIAQWQRINREGDGRIVDCPTRISTAYLSRVGSWRVPVLAGIISAPILRQDGTILAQPGYDEKTGLLFVSEKDWPAIPDRPTRADAEAALQTLLAPFAEFPFVAEEDLAVHVASIFTAIQRRLLEACPIFGYSAPAQRSGKSLLAETVAILATGKPAPATAVSGEREEIRKAITSALREGHSIINLDNIEVPLSSPDLARAITQQEYQDRVLGESLMLHLPTNVLWTATGNNLVFRGDLSSRALLCRIDSCMERPEERTFIIPHLEGFLMKNRGRLVAAVLTILRAYHVAGRPSQHISAWGGFENWSASIREPLIWAGLADPCKSREAVLADDPEREESFGALRSLHEAFAGGEFTVKEIVDLCEKDEILKNSILGLAAGRQQRHEVDSRRLGWWLRRVRDRIIGGLRLHFCGKVSGTTRWRVIKVTASGVGGFRGFGDHSSATEGTTQPVNEPCGWGNHARRPENDHQNHQNPYDPQDGDDEVAL